MCNQNRTAIIYFGKTKQDYLRMVEEKGHRELLEYIQPLLKAQLQQEQHHAHSLKIGAYYEGEGRRSCKTPTVQRLSTSIQGMPFSFVPKN